MKIWHLFYFFFNFKPLVSHISSFSVANHLVLPQKYLLIKKDSHYFVEK